ncbi:MAG: dihydropteroate synthase [Chitinivorax sp.]
MPTLRCGRFELDLRRPLIMGILNVTPDSFSDGGSYLSADAALQHAERMLADGADIIDIGGESTRPNAPEVPLQQELDRVMPVLEQLLQLGAPVSVDTRKTGVMRAALAQGVDMVNDVGALEDEGALQVVAASPAAVCLMHKRGDPQTMQARPEYADVLADVTGYLHARVAAAEGAGIGRERIVVDPGFGFGKALQHNLALLRGLAEFSVLGLPLLAGLSRKSMLGELTGAPVQERVHASVAAAMLAIQRGAAIVRVHDVRPTRDVIKVMEAIGL